jgi:hypothetical protein
MCARSTNHLRKLDEGRAAGSATTGTDGVAG